VEAKTTDESVPRDRAVTPFGGVAVFVAFWRKIDLVGQLRQYMPIQWKSRNQIEPTTTFIAFLMTVLGGAKRFAHAALLRGDQTLHALLGVERFPIDDAAGWSFTSPKVGAD
jgi:hypothetical protein